MPIASSAPSRDQTRALAADDARVRAHRRRLREQPRLLDAGAVERARDVDARRDVSAVDVQRAHRGPAERVDEDQRTARVDPEVVERRRRQESVPALERWDTRVCARATRRARATTRSARRSSTRTGTSARCPRPARRSAVDGTDSGSNVAGLSASSCSRPSIGAHVHTSASKIASRPCFIDTRIDSARLVSAQRRDLDDRRRRSSRRRGSGRRC